MMSLSLRNYSLETFTKKGESYLVHPEFHKARAAWLLYFIGVAPSMINNDWQNHVDSLISLAKYTGEGILKYARLPKKVMRIQRKDNNTLLTEADLCAHRILYEELQSLTPNIPILSEESEDGEIPSYKTRCQWQRYWLLDPLDGTRGFIEKCDEFTINIALIENNQPIIGVVYAPVRKECYFAHQKHGAFKQMDDEIPKQIHTRKMNWQSFSVYLGQFLKSPWLPRLFETISAAQIIRLNSSLKFCQVAIGDGDFYPSFGDTSEWDTAAAQCILEAAGGVIVNLSGKALQYNTKPSLTNPPFVALGDPTQKLEIIALLETKRREK